MRNLILTNKIVKVLNETEFYKSKIFIAKRTKRLGDYVIEAYETENNGDHKIILTHHKKAQAIATVFDVGMMICVDVNHKPYYYFY